MMCQKGTLIFFFSSFFKTSQVDASVFSVFLYCFTPWILRQSMIRLMRPMIEAAPSMVEVKIIRFGYRFEWMILTFISHYRLPSRMPITEIQLPSLLNYMNAISIRRITASINIFLKNSKI